MIPTVEAPAMDCPHRIGQKKTVYVLDIRSIVGPRFVKIEKTLCRQLGGFCAFGDLSE